MKKVKSSKKPKKSKKKSASKKKKISKKKIKKPTKKKTKKSVTKKKIPKKVVKKTKKKTVKKTTKKKTKNKTVKKATKKKIHIQKIKKPVLKKSEMEKIKKRIEEKLSGKMIKEMPSKITDAKKARKKMKKGAKLKGKIITSSRWLKTGIPGFDDLIEKGIPKGSFVLIAGGPGTGKTILSLQTAIETAKAGKKCYYITFEEDVDKLKQHMKDFGWDIEKYEKKGLIKIKKIDPFSITRSVEAMLEQSKGELMIDVNPVDLPKGFKPDRIIIDSLSAIASAFMGKEESYRIYVEHLFKFFKEFGATVFMITEIVDLAKSLTEEFMADGVIVLYYIKHGTVRERAIEILKLRGAKHEEKIVAFQISDEGIVVYPDQEVFGELNY